MKWTIAILILGALIVIGRLYFWPSAGEVKKSAFERPSAKKELDQSDSPPRASSHPGPETIYPNPNRTPGATNPDITQQNIGETICNPNWSTKMIRPPSSYTSRLKRQQIHDWNLADADGRDYEEDHFIPLELGGHPSDPKNLWPESYDEPGARQKDKVENQLHREVCDGNVTLDRAQRIIVEDWYSCYLHLENHELCE
jgi:hypothetical protein